MNHVALIFILITLIAQAVSAQLHSSRNGDPRVKGLIEELEWKYTIDSDGDFKLTFDAGQGRSQLVFVNSNTSNFGVFEIREIWAIAYKSVSPFSSSLANKLLKDNSQKKWTLGKFR